MSTGAFSLDQLMELAGLSVSQAGKTIDFFSPIHFAREMYHTHVLSAVYKLHPPSKGKRILVACGPGNNGQCRLIFVRRQSHPSY